MPRLSRRDLLLPVPGGAPGDMYHRIASHGMVDPATEISYCVATTDIGNTEGMFAIPAIGAPVQLIDPGGRDNETGQWYRPLLPPG